MFLCFAVLAAMSVGCSNTAILSGTDTASIETQSYDHDADDGYVSVKLQLPENVGRGWKDIASYNVTATRGDDVEEFTSPTPSMSVRLKVGTWYFSANAKDEYGNILYSAASSATIGLKSSQVYIGLLKRVGQVKVSMNIDNIISGVVKPQRYEVKADRGQGFAPVIGEVNNIEDTVTLSGLAQGEWTLTCTAYSVPSSDPTAQATVPYYQGTSTVYVEASQTKSVSVALDALKVAPPTFSHSGEVKANTEVTISSQQSGVKIYVTTDGKDPSTGASDKAPACPYVLTISKATTVKAAAYIAGIGFSEVVTKEFTVVAADKCVAPQISPESQTIVGTGYCSITCDEVGAAIYYTTDGTTPTTDSTLYVDKIEINQSMTVKAIAVKAGLTNSDVVSATYTYQKQKCAAPTIDPLSGTFAPGQIIRISQNTAGSTTYYLISDDKNDSASSEDDNTKSFTNDGFDIDTSKYNAGTYYITAFSRIAGREDSDTTKATITIKPANNDDNVIYMCIDNLIVTTQETNLYKEVGTMPTNSVVWYGFTHDAGGSVYIDVEPSTVSAELFKNGQKDEARLTLVNNVATLSGENYYYLKLTAQSLSSNVKVRVYSTTSPEIITLESLSIAAGNKNVQVGNTTELTAVAYFSNESSRSVVPTWNISDTSIATISGTTLTAVKAGETTISAEYTYEGVTKTSNSVKITVASANPVKTLQGVNVSEASNSTAESPKFTAKAYYTDGSSKDVTSTASWSSSAETVATVSKGVVTLKAAGNADITVSYTEGVVTKSGAKQTVKVTEVGGGNGAINKLYLKPGVWNVDNAWFAAYFFNNNNNEWVKMTASSNNGVFVCSKPANSYTKVIFTRMDKNKTEVSWDSKWNQTADLDIPSDKDTYSITGWGESEGSWDSALTGTYSSGNGTLSATIESGDNPDPIPTTTTTTLPPIDGLRIYVKSSDAPTIWAWESNGGTSLSEGLKETWDNQPKMVSAVGMYHPEGWYMKDFSSVSLAGTGTIVFKLNKGGEVDSKKTQTFWYDGQSFLDEDPTKPKEPVKPSAEIKPADGGKLPLNGAVTVSLNNGNDTISAASVTIGSKSYSYSDFSNDTLSVSAAALGVSQGQTVTVSVSVTNSKGNYSTSATLTVVKESTDFFTWDNVNAYFVLTDRFYDGNSSNNASYGRQRATGDEDVATFHGGDIKGLTAKMDYFKNLGVNAIWITAPYEQVHGWVAGGKSGQFPHYAFHGYYTLDWTAMDANMGTLAEFREFVNACHANGIRVVMDIVMNHVGYNNVADMVTYNHGSTPHNATWFAKTNGTWNANDGVQWENSLWDNSWWGPWIRSFGYASGSDYGGSCGGLPDIKSEIKTSVGMAPVLRTKWNTDSNTVKSAYYNPSVANADWNGYSGDYRTDKGIAPADYQVVWLSAWVREFGIDGFRCDTAKHVEKERWAQLKVACQAALEKWRNDPNKIDNSGAKDWDEAFWMTGEAWGWPGTNTGDYFGDGKFDSMIDFSFNGGNNWDGNYRTRYPGSSDWSTYIGYNTEEDSDHNGNKNRRFAYISSHDTSLTRVGDQKAVGTGLVLLPGGVQIYYGDESYRPKAYTGCGDGDMFTRGDMNWSEIEGNRKSLVEHWGKVGRFRKFNPAVGAGTGSATKRTYNGPAGENKVAISVSGTQVDVSGLWDDETDVYNWYDGATAKVSGGKVTFAGGTMEQPILVSDKNPTQYQ